MDEGRVSRSPDPHHGKRMLVTPAPELAAAITPAVTDRAVQGRARLSTYTVAELTLIRDFLTATRERHAAHTERLRKPATS